MARTAVTAPANTISSRRGPRALAAATAVAVALLLAGCGDRAQPAAAGAGGPPVTATPSAEVTATPSAATTATADAGTQAATPAPALVARATGRLPVFDAPEGAPVKTLPATTGFGSRTVALVIEDGDAVADGWLEVLLAGRPNGATGWVSADDVELREVALEVRVDLDARTITVLDGGEQLLTTATAIGDRDHPTPAGRFYVVDKLETPDPDGAYGPFAIGLSARSEVLTEFGGGDGQIGIHGTNAPDSIGRAVSHGCLRVDNEVITQLADLLPLGTPVTIV